MPGSNTLTRMTAVETLLEKRWLTRWLGAL
jgi:hypothetical protein